MREKTGRLKVSDRVEAHPPVPFHKRILEGGISAYLVVLLFPYMPVVTENDAVSAPSLDRLGEDLKMLIIRALNLDAAANL
jgi:hypothetical protein